MDNRRKEGNKLLSRHGAILKVVLTFMFVISYLVIKQVIRSNPEYGRFINRVFSYRDYFQTLYINYFHPLFVIFFFIFFYGMLITIMVMFILMGIFMIKNIPEDLTSLLQNIFERFEDTETYNDMDDIPPPI